MDYGFYMKNIKAPQKYTCFICYHVIKIILHTEVNDTNVTVFT